MTPAALELPRHARAAARTALYLLLGVPYGLAYWILLPLAPRLAELERRQANRLLDAHLAPAGDAPRRRVTAMLALRLPLSLAGLVAAAVPVALAAALLVLGLEGVGGVSDRLLGPWLLGPAVGLALCAFALPAAVVSVATLDGIGQLVRRLVQRLLRPVAEGAGPVRELLAERLGDRSLNIAYWLPDRGIFVDERGSEVELPGAGSGRAWTAVDRDGRRVAAIVHDAELDATPELVHAAASAAALALDNERLKADLRARLEDLRISRRRIVEAADEARRRIERDLHDGAQQQLVSLALELRMLRAQLRDHPAAGTVDDLSAALASALAELRELARGIHPAVLSDHGLAPAIRVLVDRAPVPVEADVAVDTRLPAPVEAAAYFVVAEALTNVAKYAGATGAVVRVHRHGDELRVAIADDGVGGARLDGGSGLRGLSDRVAALEGALDVDSPLGDGTRVEARIPL